jgi:DNA helicase-2/ATP-dependent DNA helicase PcrA
MANSTPNQELISTDDLNLAVAVAPIATPTIEVPPTVRKSKTSSFDELYAQLNEEQKMAVDTIEGPVMVVAGAGTGKTQVLTLRIANILKQTQLNPRNILALTFTENAAQNMRKRLVKVIGAAAYSVGIYTFHGFANLVITEFPYKFQFAKELQQLDEIQQIEIIEKLLDTLDLEQLRPPRAPHHYLREIISRIGELKKENVTPKELAEITATLKDQLEQDPASFHEKGAHKGKMKATIAEEIKQLGRCNELATIYSKYQEALQEKGLYDYEDMILFVIKQFEVDEELKQYYQERFQYILVDEYQDTNNAQNRLVEQLADFFESPNVFVVGDDKQSIFRFQGASLANMLTFYQKYPDMKVISLRHNYRSHQTILDGSHHVIGNAKERITTYLQGIEDQLIASHPRFVTPTSETDQSGGVAPVCLATFSSPDIERYWIATQIEQLLAKGVPAEEIAIIYKENREAEPFADLLGRLNIPFNLERGSNVLADADIRRLMTILKTIQDPNDSQALFEFMHYDFTGVAGIDLLRVMAHRAKNRQSLLELLDTLNETDIELTDKQRLLDLYSKLGEWRQASANKSLPELVELVLQESGLLQQITSSPTRIERLHRLRRFFDEVKRLATRNTELRLEHFLQHIELLVNNNIQLVPEPLDLGERQGTVRLMTAHKAKGLEFSHVFLPNLTDKHWGNTSRRTLIKLPGSIIAQPQLNPDEKNEDDRRLFYVAMTRAKEHLYLTHATASNGRELLPTQFLAEIDPDIIDVVDTSTSEIEAGAHLLVLFSPIAETNFSEQEAAYLRELIAQQPITPTGLNNYLRCPKGYLYKNLLRIPTAKGAQQGYGTAIHAAMQAFFLKHKATKHVPSLDDLIQAFTDALDKEILSTTEYTDFLRTGKEVLTKYYERHLKSVTPTVAVEYSFAHHHVLLKSDDGDIQITGVLDKLELLDPKTNSVRVIDYKTGRARSRNEIEGKTASADEDYKRQLIFYQMLADLDPQFPYKVTETGLAFVDDGGRFPIELFEITKDEVEDLKTLIKNVYKQMLTLEFPHLPDPNRPPCDFCEM